MQQSLSRVCLQECWNLYTTYNATLYLFFPICFTCLVNALNFCSLYLRYPCIGMNLSPCVQLHKAWLRFWAKYWHQHANLLTVTMLMCLQTRPVSANCLLDIKTDLSQMARGVWMVHYSALWPQTIKCFINGQDYFEISLFDSQECIEKI